MKTPRRTVAAFAAVALSTTLAQAPAMATEGGAAEGEHEKISLPESQHDLVGLALFGLVGLAALGGLANARRQLRGERDQASGEFRWR